MARTRESRVWIHVTTRACATQDQCQVSASFSSMPVLMSGRQVRCAAEAGGARAPREARVRRSIAEASSSPGRGSLVTVRRLQLRGDAVVSTGLGLQETAEADYYEAEEEEEVSSADFTENLGVAVTRPGDGYYLGDPPESAAVADPSCSTYLMFGILMGSLLIVASLMMCILAYRLNTMAATHKVRVQRKYFCCQT